MDFVFADYFVGLWGFAFKDFVSADYLVSTILDLAWIKDLWVLLCGLLLAK